MLPVSEVGERTQRQRLRAVLSDARPSGVGLSSTGTRWCGSGLAEVQRVGGPQGGAEPGHLVLAYGGRGWQVSSSTNRHELVVRHMHFVWEHGKA